MCGDDGPRGTDRDRACAKGHLDGHVYTGDTPHMYSFRDLSSRALPLPLPSSRNICTHLHMRHSNPSIAKGSIVCCSGPTCTSTSDTIRDFRNASGHLSLRRPLPFPRPFSLPPAPAPAPAPATSLGTSICALLTRDMDGRIPQNKSFKLSDECAELDFERCPSRGRIHAAQTPVVFSAPPVAPAELVPPAPPAPSPALSAPPRDAPRPSGASPLRPCWPLPASAAVMTPAYAARMPCMREVDWIPSDAIGLFVVLSTWLLAAQSMALLSSSRIPVCDAPWKTQSHAMLTQSPRGGVDPETPISDEEGDEEEEGAGELDSSEDESDVSDEGDDVGFNLEAEGDNDEDEEEDEEDDEEEDDEEAAVVDDDEDDDDEEDDDEDDDDADANADAEEAAVRGGGGAE